MKRVLIVLAAAVAFAALAVGSASADYGNSAQYQIELSVNIPGVQGGGVWLWIELNANGGDYTGSDCGHAGQGAVADKGDVSWTDANGWITITGVKLNGLGKFPTTVKVPDTWGHYTGTDQTYMTLPGFIPPGIGNSQLEVAP